MDKNCIQEFYNRSKDLHSTMDYYEFCRKLQIDRDDDDSKYFWSAWVKAGSLGAFNTNQLEKLFSEE